MTTHSQYRLPPSPIPQITRTLYATPFIPLSLLCIGGGRGGACTTSLRHYVRPSAKRKGRAGADLLLGVLVANKRKTPSATITMLSVSRGVYAVVPAARASRDTGTSAAPAIAERVQPQVWLFFRQVPPMWTV